MPIQFLIFCVCLVLLWFLSRGISTALYRIFYRITHSRRISIYLLALILVPGTFLHEFAHLFVATLVRVPAGKLTVIPTIEEGGEVRAGSVMIARTDPFRHALIGLAPLILGIPLVYATGKYFFPTPLELTTYNVQPATIAGFSLLFMISNTMFSSKKDLETLVFVIPGLLLIIFVLHLLGLRITFDESLIEYTRKALAAINIPLGISVCLNVAIFAFLKILLLGSSWLHRHT